MKKYTAVQEMIYFEKLIPFWKQYSYDKKKMAFLTLPIFYMQNYAYSFIFIIFRLYSQYAREFQRIK